MVIGEMEIYMYRKMRSRAKGMENMAEKMGHGVLAIAGRRERVGRGRDGRM